MTSDRGQSETIGAILLVAIAVIAVSIVAGTLFAASAPTSHPNARIDATANGSNVSIEHRAGEPIHEDDFEIILRNTGSTLPGPIGTPHGTWSDGDATFEPGETWVFNAGYVIEEGESVILVYTDGDRVLLDEERIGPEPTATITTTESTTVAGESTTSTASATATVTPTTTSTALNQAPEANFTISRNGNSDNVYLDASASSDSDGSIESYEWDIDADGSVEYTGETVNNANAPAGTEVKLIVTDDDGATDVLTKQAPDDGGGGGGRGNGGPPRP